MRLRILAVAAGAVIAAAALGGVFWALADDDQTTRPGALTIPTRADYCFGKPATVSGNIGTDADDVIIGTDGGEVLASGGGYDLICGRGGNDVIVLSIGGASTDAGGNKVDAGPGNDKVDRNGTGPKANIVYGRSGNDTLDGALLDTLNGGPDYDRCIGGGPFESECESD